MSTQVDTTVAPPAAPAQAGEPPVLYGWSLESGHAVLHANPDFDAAAKAAEATAFDSRLRLSAASQSTADLPEVLEAAKLARLLAEAEQAQGEAQECHAAAGEQARLAWQEGRPAELHEKAVQTAARKVEGTALRLAHLRKQLAAARPRADAAARAVVEAAWRGLLEEHRKRRFDLLDRIDAVLKPLLTELLANDSAEGTLYDARTGGPPSGFLSRGEP
jgi:hypothetical protein